MVPPIDGAAVIGQAPLTMAIDGNAAIGDVMVMAAKNGYMGIGLDKSAFNIIGNRIKFSTALMEENKKEFMRFKKESIWFEKFASKAIRATGSSAAFIIACLLILVCVIAGIIFHSSIWPMLINTITNSVTFLMVFLIQKTQNKDAISIQIKLNELVAANENASNRIISVEDLSERELIRLNEHYTRLAELTKEEKDLKSMHSIEDVTISKEERERFGRKEKVSN